MPMPYAPPGYFGGMPMQPQPQYPPVPYGYSAMPAPQMQPVGYSQANQPMVSTPSSQSSWEIISVQSEDEARRYPVAPGNTVTFKNENLPYYYTKTVSFSQFEPPKFERYSLIKEDADITVPAVEVGAQPIPQMDYATTNDIRALQKQIEELEDLITRPADKTPKKEVK